MGTVMEQKTDIDLVIFREKLIPGMIAKLAARMFDAGLFVEICVDGPIYPSIKYGRTQSSTKFGDRVYDHELVLNRSRDNKVEVSIDRSRPIIFGGIECLKDFDRHMIKLISQIPDLPAPPSRGR